jgi:acetylornithine deacetylase/succinyl-diaminopimelate desuccinylase-like protein
VQPDFGRIEPDALRLLELLCRQPSVSAQGQVLQETADLVEELLVEAGFDTRQLRADGGPPAVYGEQRGRGDYTLLLYNHYDVQPAEPLELWETPPFEPTLRDGKLFARGAADNKGELAVRLAVVQAFREQAGELPIGIRWIVEGEEEVTEVAQAGDGFVEDELALADQQHAALGAIGGHVGSLRSRRGNAATSISCRRNEFVVVVRARECLSGLFP